MTHPVYRFGDYRLDAAARELSSDGELIVLPATVFDCLVYLLEHRDRAVGRDELMAAVWGRADVTDTLLGQTILKVRRTLGDTGEAQHTIRTVPRFGYRWVAEVEIDKPDVMTAATNPTGESPVASPAPTAVQDRRPALRTQLVGLALTALIVIATAMLWQLTGKNAQSQGSGDAPDLPQPLAGGALVLPSRVVAPDDWAWLRLGLMDLVAERLQRAQLPTVPSESVVGLLRGGKNDADALDRDPALAHLATWRIQPEARFDSGVWQVVLDARSPERRIAADGEASDVVQAARAATDALLLKLGRQPPPGGGEIPALDELMQRTRAAMLGDQFELARTLIRNAPPKLSERPELVHRLAQIELRAGHYETVERLLLDLMPRLASDREPALRGRALVTLGASHVRRDQADAAKAAYEEAISLLEGRGEPAALGLAYLGRGLVAAMHGRLDEATAELGRARVEMQGAGDALGVAQVDLNLGLFDVMRQRPADGLAKLKASAERFETLGSREELVYTLSQIAETESVLLDHDQALATTDRFWPPETHSGNERLRWDLLLIRAHALARLGQLGDAQALVDRLLGDADPALDAPRLAKARALAVRLAFDRGNVNRAAEEASAALTSDLAEISVRHYLDLWHIRLRALRHLGRASEASEALERLMAWSQESRPDRHQRIALHAQLAQAEHAAHQGDWDDSKTAYESALADAEAMGVPDDLVEVAHSYALALLIQGDTGQAQSVAGRIAPWAERDLRAAEAQARLFRALNQPQAWQQANRRVADLAGERRIEAD